MARPGSKSSDYRWEVLKKPVLLLFPNFDPRTQPREVRTERRKRSATVPIWGKKSSETPVFLSFFVFPSYTLRIAGSSFSEDLPSGMATLSVAESLKKTGKKQGKRRVFETFPGAPKKYPKRRMTAHFSKVCIPYSRSPPNRPACVSGRPPTDGSEPVPDAVREDPGCHFASS